MDLRDKLAVLADAAKYDASCASSGSRRGNGGEGLGDTDGVGICHSYTPDGRCVSLLKILLTNYCVYDCRYCVNRVSSDVRRARFSPAEVVWLTMAFYRRNYIEGLFLSSGIIQSPDYTMEQIAEVARRLREEERFFGYIHLKAVPGASAELIERVGRHADRLSANVELPSDEDLRRLAPEKTMAAVELTMSAIRGGIEEAGGGRGAAVRPADAGDQRARSGGDGGRGGAGGGAKRAWRFAPAGQSTQMIVGATAATDGAILRRASELYRAQRLRRVYYSAFSPIPAADGLLPSVTPPLVREHRLYQADWLIRHYGFTADEIAPADSPDLPHDMDPKLAWALRHREFFPVDVNRAGRGALLRVPGLGVRSVGRILEMRKVRAVRLADLSKLRVAVRRARAFIVTADHNPEAMRVDAAGLEERVRPRDGQMELFRAGVTARTGEL